MNYSMQKLYEDFLKKIGHKELTALESMPADTALNYMYFLYSKFYEAYPTGEMYTAIQDTFRYKQAA